MRASVWIGTVCALGLAAGCGASKPVVVSGQDQGGDVPSSDPGRPNAVTLLDTGAAPLTPLRYQVSAKPQEARLDIALRVESAGKNVVSPTVRFTIKAEPGAQDGDEIAYTAQITGAEVLEDAQIPAAAREQIAQELKTYVGLKVEAVSTSRGLSQQALFELPDNVGENIEMVMDTLQGALGTLAVPLPDEAVGVGARWQVDSVVPGLVPMKRIATYTLTSLEEGTATVDVKLEYSGKPQELRRRGQSDGAKQELLALSGQGSGRATLRLSELLPASAVTFGLKSTVRVTRPKTEQTLETDVSVDLSLSPNAK